MDEVRKRYYEREIAEGELSHLYNSEDYWMGITSDWDGGILDRKHYAKRDAYYTSVAMKVYARGPTSALEVGCGIGQVVNKLNELGIDTVGVDISQWAVSHALNPKVLQGNLLSLPFSDKQFDLVFSNDVLEHITVIQLEKAIAELQRVGERNYHIISCGSLPDDRDITHVTMHTIRWWRNRLPPDFEVEKKV